MECLSVVILIFSGIFALAILVTLIVFIFSRRSVCSFPGRASASRRPRENHHTTHQLATDDFSRRPNSIIFDFATHTSYDLTRAGGSFKKEVHPVEYGAHEVPRRSIEDVGDSRPQAGELPESLSGSLADGSGDGSDKTEVYIDPSADRFNKLS